MFLLTSVFSTALLFGQGPGNAPRSPNAPNQAGPPNPATMIERRVNRLTAQLGLNATQEQQATKFFTDAATSASTLFNSMRTAREDLRVAIQHNDSNTIKQVSVTIGNLTAQLTSVEALAQASFYGILTPDQQTKYNQLEARQRMRMGPHPGPDGGPGPGAGPGGPPPPGFRGGHDR